MNEKRSTNGNDSGDGRGKGRGREKGGNRGECRRGDGKESEEDN